MAHTLASDYPSDEAEHLASLRQRYTSIVDDIRLPSLDEQLMRKYFIEGQVSLPRLQSIVEILEDHRTQTLFLMSQCAKRDAIVSSLKSAIDDFASRSMTALQFQATVLEKMSEHQQITLRIIEAIFVWRELLCLPYSFQVSGRNYILQILTECVELDRSAMMKVLPLHLEQYPLCSNIPALATFTGGPLRGTRGKVRPPPTPRRSQQTARGGKRDSQ